MFLKVGIIVRESKTGKVINVSKDLPSSLKGKVLTTGQSKKISRGDYTKTRSGVKISSAQGGVTIIQDKPLSVGTSKTGVEVSKSRTQIVGEEKARLEQVRSAESRSVTPTHVYDQITQETRALTPFESEAIGSTLQSQRVSVDTRDKIGQD